MHLNKLKHAWESESKEFTSRPETLEQYCLHAPGTELSRQRHCRILTEEPYFQVEGEERILLSYPRFSNKTNAQKCPAYKEKFGQHRPGRADALRPAHPPSGDDNNPLLIKLLKEKLQGVENENNRLKQENETLRNENDALQQQGQGAEERAIDVDLDELRDKVQQRLKKEGERMATALTNIDESDEELRSKLQPLRDKYNQEVGSLEKANSIKEMLEHWDMVAQLGQQFNDEIQLKKRTEAGLNVIGRGEKRCHILNHTMRALQLDFCPQDVKDARMDCYNYWLQKACDYCNITGNQLAKQLKEKYPEYNRFVNTLADFEVRLWAMREDLACFHMRRLLAC